MSPSATSAEQPYYLVPNLQALDPTVREVDLDAHAWMMPTIIEDEDLTFGGKSLSAWHEEDRRQVGEEERRGRARVRQEYSPSKHSHHPQHHHSSAQSTTSDKKC